MAFGDAIRAKTATFNDIADKLDGLRKISGEYSQTAVTIDTTSTSYVDMSGVTLTLAGLTATQKVLVIFAGQLSHSNSGYRTTLQLLQNGSAGFIAMEAQSFTTSTGGIDIQICQAWRITASAGSNTFKMQWRTPSGGTTYSGRQILIAAAFENT